MNFLKSVAIAAATAVSVTFAAQAQDSTTKTPPTPETNPVMLAFAFNDVIGRYDYKTERDCRLGAYAAYQDILKTVNGDEKKMSGSYFCVDKNTGIVGYGAVRAVENGRDSDIQKAYPNIKLLAPTYGLDSRPMTFDPQ